jgi:hypothetical protein
VAIILDPRPDRLGKLNFIPLMIIALAAMLVLALLLWRGQTNPSLGYRRTMPRRRKIRPS